MRFRWAVLILVVLTILANWPLYQLVQQDYIPTNVDELCNEMLRYRDACRDGTADEGYVDNCPLIEAVFGGFLQQPR